jgi:hypothetical protein
MFHLIKRHPIPIRAQFEFVLVLTYAVPARSLITFLTPGLRLDEWNGYGFLAVAFVQTKHLRPAILPSFLGQNFFLIGYRVFCRYRCRNGRNLRGLLILRSDTDRKVMAVLGNLLTHYNYQIAQVEIERSTRSLQLHIVTPDGSGDIQLNANLSHPGRFIPDGSPFSNEQEARRFTGPMPFTFDYEQETNSTILIQGVRKQWRPRLVPVAVNKLGFVEQDVFSEAKPVLASCFYIEGIDYLWKRGVREALA